MNTSKFAEVLIRDVINLNSLLYQRMFDDELLADQPRKDLDPEFQRSLELYASLSDGQREVLIQRFRQITIDSVSSVLGIIDGSSSCEEFPGTFSLSYEGQEIGSGTLQDAFLERIEKIDRK